ncbi:MAG TPA: PfkB family carbohydrate kinase [Burkholderiales bacterium]|jgi:sulfofructose kinase|nr:PfkB family carbohydrate kinase [Burkholderiales bacterium]
MKVICVGHAALDRIFTVDSWPADSGKIAATRYEECGGGMMANAAVTIARLGGTALLWGPTGEDAVAAAVRAQLHAEGVDVENLRGFEGKTTSHSAVLIDRRGERLVVGYRGSALAAPADWLPLGAVASADAVMVDVRWPQGAAAALGAARKAGVPSILDGEVAPQDVLDALTRLADHVVFSERGLAQFGGADYEGGLRRALKHGARVACVTRGKGGALWLEHDAPRALRACPAVEVPVVDTLGAGDVFHGAYTLAIAEGDTVGEAIRFASVAAAIKCTRPGGRAGAPTRAEVMEFLARTELA